MIVNIPISIDEEALAKTIDADVIRHALKKFDEKYFSYPHYGDEMFKTECKEAVEKHWDEISERVVKELSKNLARSKKGKAILDLVDEQTLKGDT